MDAKSEIKKELAQLDSDAHQLFKFLNGEGKGELHFHFDYQKWYSKALKTVELLAPDRYEEFRKYYERDPKRKSPGYGTWVIQDYVKGTSLNKRAIPGFDRDVWTAQNLLNQSAILNSLADRIDSVLNNLEGGLYAEFQDAELQTSQQLLKVSPRAAGSLAGVVIEGHLQKVAVVHGVKIKKKSPTISDLNDPLRQAGVYDISEWRKITFLADIRNECTHKKDIEPTKEKVQELIEGANWVTKTIQ